MKAARMSLDSLDREKLLNFYTDAEQTDQQNRQQIHENRYQDKELIGEGGVKKVYKAYDTIVDRYIALAELKQANTEIKREAFLREAQLTAQLDHPNIISIYDIADDSASEPWFSMELKPGLNMKDWIEKQTDPIKARLPFLSHFLKVCDAIDYAHSKNILHLDLKPENIQFGQHGEVLVCDWGLGQMLNIEDQQDLIHAGSEQMELFKDVTITGKIKGTPGFMAPEQIHHKMPKGFQTDIYALGALLYTGLCSHPPLSGSIDELLQKTQAGDILFPRQKYPQLAIPESLDAVVRKAMALDPQDRYANVSELIQDIQQYLSGFTTEAENAHLLKELYLFYKRHQLACSITLLALCFISIVVYVYQAHLNDTLEQLHRANQSIEKERDRSEQALLQAIKNKSWLNNLVLDNEVQLTKSVYDYCAIEIYKDPIKAMDLAVHELKLMKDANPENRFNTTQLGYVYAIIQNFPKSFQAYSEEPPGIRDTFEPIREMALTHQGKRPLPPEALIDYLSKMKNGHNPLFALRLLYYDAKLRNNWAEHSKLAHFVLKLWNPNWKNDEFIYQPDSKTLSLKGQGLSQLTYHHTANSTTRNWDLQVNLIGSMPVERLSLNGSDYYDFASLKDLPIHWLDISNTSIKQLLQIDQFKQLKTLIIHKSQFKSKKLKKTPDHIQVIVKQ